MNPVESQKEYEKSYHFFLSELKNINESDLSNVIELMRASQHIKDLQKLMLSLNPQDMDEISEIKYWFENDSLLTLILNLSAAQLREALKIFWIFTGTEFFNSIKDDLSNDQKKEIDSMIQYTSEYNQKKGFIFDILKPMRNSIFHYSPDKVVSWIEKIKDMESDRKPCYQSINLETYDFGPGKEYDKDIYSNYLFWGSDGFNSLMESQNKVWDLQIQFLEATKIILTHLIKTENIPKRKYGWFMKYFHGYKT